MLGGGKINRVNSITHYECSTPKVTNRTVSKEGISNLCRHLCTDIQWYKKLITSAINSNDEDKMTTFDELKKTCPIEASLTKYPENKQMRKGA